MKLFNRTVSAALLLVVFFIMPLGALPPSGVISTAEQEVLRSGRIITDVYLEHSGRLHSLKGELPGRPKIAATPWTRQSWNSNELIVIEKSFLPVSADPIEIFNLLNRYSALEGMLYYSKSAKKVETLIQDAYRVESPENRNAATDRSFSSLSNNTSYFMMKDNRFGNLLYRSTILVEGETIAMVNTCMDPLKKMGFTIAGPGRYHMITILMRDQLSGGWFLYSVTTSPVRNTLFLRLKIVSPKSFGNRLRASTVHLARGVGLDWKNRLPAFP